MSHRSLQISSTVQFQRTLAACKFRDVHSPVQCLLSHCCANVSACLQRQGVERDVCDRLRIALHLLAANALSPEGETCMRACHVCFDARPAKLETQSASSPGLVKR